MRHIRIVRRCVFLHALVLVGAKIDLKGESPWGFSFFVADGLDVWYAVGNRSAPAITAVRPSHGAPLKRLGSDRAFAIPHLM